MQFVGAFNAGAQHGRTEAMEIAAAGIEDKQALRGKDFGIEVSEGLGKGASGLIGGSERFHCVGVAEQFPRALYERSDGCVENYAADRNGRCGRFLVDEPV